MGQWSELPGDLLNDIEERLVLYVDKVRFRSVCVSWNSYSLKVKMPDHHQVRQLPWLLHATQDKNSEISHGLFYPLERKVYHLDLPEAQGMIFKGSSHGWVVTIEDTIARTGPTMHLINPLTRARIQLPSRSEFPDVINYCSDKIGSEYHIQLPYMDATVFTSLDHVNLYLLQKVVLSATPSREDCVVVAIYGECGRLAYCKRNDKKWTFLFGERKQFTDIIFHKGKLHALSCWGELLES